jgi:flagellar basal-body rod modification protein FlgD
MSTIEGVIGNSSGSLQTMDTTDAVGKDDFLKMMIAQLQNQDPLNPLDGTDFTAQLAQFSSLEQLYNINTQLETVSLYQSSMNSTAAMNLVGKEVTVGGDGITVDEDSVDISYNLAQDAGIVTVNIYDGEGSLAAVLEPGVEGQKEGNNTITWDCSNMESGNYTFEISAVSASGDEIAVDTLLKGIVEGVTFEDGSPFLVINGQSVSFGDILSIGEST